jgi:hypothetical protein
MSREAKFILTILAIFILSALIEPCDGHSCKQEVSDVR